VIDNQIAWIIIIIQYGKKWRRAYRVSYIKP
jgi:hypothetical protein